MSRKPPTRRSTASQGCRWIVYSPFWLIGMAFFNWATDDVLTYQFNPFTGGGSLLEIPALLVCGAGFSLSITYGVFLLLKSLTLPRE